MGFFREDHVCSELLDGGVVASCAVRDNGGGPCQGRQSWSPHKNASAPTANGAASLKTGTEVFELEGEYEPTLWAVDLLDGTYAVFDERQHAEEFIVQQNAVISI